MRTLLLLLAACTDDEAPTSDTETATIPTPTVSTPAWTASLGPVANLTTPQGGQLHSHATFDYDGDGRVLIAFSAGTAPNTTPLAQIFEEDGTPASELTPLSSSGDKPDVSWDGGRWIVGWNDGAGRVFLGAIGTDGAAEPATQLYDTVESGIDGLEADAVDLATHADGTGIAIWSEFCGFEGPEGCATFMGVDDGFIRWVPFDTNREATTTARMADNSSKKASDVDSLPDGAWVGVWAREVQALAGNIVFEVWGRMYREDGTLWTFRADDLDSALPSRPAVGSREDGVFAVVWRDKNQAEGADNGAGAFVRLFDADATPLGPSRQLDPGGDGDRVVVDWAGDLAIVAWQETDTDGILGIEMAAVHMPTGQLVIDRLKVHPTGGESDERPSIAVRQVGGEYHVLFVWEAIQPGTNFGGLGIRSRIVTLTPG